MRNGILYGKKQNHHQDADNYDVCDRCLHNTFLRLIQRGCFLCFCLLVTLCTVPCHRTADTVSAFLLFPVNINTRSGKEQCDHNKCNKINHIRSPSPYEDAEDNRTVPASSRVFHVSQKLSLPSDDTPEPSFCGST